MDTSTHINANALSRLKFCTLPIFGYVALKLICLCLRIKTITYCYPILGILPSDFTEECIYVGIMLFLMALLTISALKINRRNCNNIIYLNKSTTHNIYWAIITIIATIGISIITITTPNASYPGHNNLSTFMSIEFLILSPLLLWGAISLFLALKGKIGFAKAFTPFEFLSYIIFALSIFTMLINLFGYSMIDEDIMYGVGIPPFKG